MKKKISFQMLGIIMGNGAIPRLLVETCPKEIFAIAYRGCTDPGLLGGIDHAWFSLGEVGAVLSTLHQRNIHEVVFAGYLRRPALRHIHPDKEGLRLLARIGFSWPGDDRILTIIRDFLKEKGFIVKSPQDILPSLFLDNHSESYHKPSAHALQDIAKGKKVLDHLSPLDIGHGVAIQNGHILGIEAAEGTDQCISRCGELKNKTEPLPVYVKCAKIGQNEQMDLPAIGPQTIKTLSEAGFQGLAFERHKTLVIDQQTVQLLAETAKIFLWPF